MTLDELYNSILGIKSGTLECNRIYLTKCKIGSEVTFNRQKDLLTALDVYIQILDYYYDVKNQDSDLITEDEILVIIAEASKIIRIFKDSYYGR